MKWTTRAAIVAATAAIVMSQIGFAGLRVRKSDVPKAMKNLKSGTPKQKAAAAETLGQIGSLRVVWVKDAITPLRNALRDKDAGVRGAAATALGKIGLEPKKTAQMLLKMLKTDKEDAAKIGAMRGLARMRSEARAAMPELRKLARDKKNKKLAREARNIMRALK